MNRAKVESTVGKNDLQLNRKSAYFIQRDLTVLPEKNEQNKRQGI